MTMIYVGQTPSSAPDPLVRLWVFVDAQADEGVGRGPGARPTFPARARVTASG